MFGDEPHGNYNRILLSGVLAGTHRLDESSSTRCLGTRPTASACMPATGSNASTCRPPGDRRRRKVNRTTALVIATGSRPLLPPIDGTGERRWTLKDGAFVFRTIDNCDRMLARAKTLVRRW